MVRKESKRYEAPRTPPGPHHTARPRGTAMHPAGGHLPAGQRRPSGSADLPLRRVKTRPADDYGLRPLPRTNSGGKPEAEHRLTPPHRRYGKGNKTTLP